LRSGFKEVDLS